MSKYEPLWRWIEKNGSDRLKLSYHEIEEILGFSIDHSFLPCHYCSCKEGR